MLRLLLLQSFLQLLSLLRRREMNVLGSLLLLCQAFLSLSTDCRWAI